MHMKKQLLALAAVAALTASPAFALTIDQTLAITGNNSTLSFNDFNSSLGTLNSVTLSFTDSVTTTGKLANTSNASKMFTLTEKGVGHLTGAGFDLGGAMTDSSGTSYSLLGKMARGYAPASISVTAGGGDTDTLSSDLAAFIDTGDIDFLFSGSVKPGFVGTAAGSLSNLLSTFGGSATLSYDYTAPPPVVISPPSSPISGPAGAVPEPSVWAMLILGFASIGVAMRRRRTEAAAVA